MREYKKKYGTFEYKMQDFESMSEIAQYFESIKDLSKFSLTKESMLRSESSFYGVSKFDDIPNRLKYGDEKVTTIYLDKFKQINTEEAKQDEMKMDIEGFAYDMGAAVSGEPECCLNTGYPSIKPHLNIYIDTGYNGSVSPKIIANRGVAILQLISNLLSSGYILDIWVIHYISTWDGGLYCQRIKLNTDYLTVSQLAFSGTCEFFRVVTWLLTAIQKGSYSYTGSGQSMPKSDVVRALQKDGLFIPSGYTDGRFNTCTLEQAQDYVIDIYNRYVEEHNEGQKSN